jgi:hypothetical protein
MGSNKKIAKLQNSEVEPDTDWEEQLAVYLHQWIEYSNADRAGKLYQYKEDIQDLAEVNPWLKYSGDLAYRATVIHDQEVIDAFAQQYIKSPGKKIYELQVNYTPHIKVQSWTESLSFAKSFKNYIEKDALRIVLIENDLRDFYFPHKILYQITGVTTQQTKREKEILRFSDQPKKMRAVSLNSDIQEYIQNQNSKFAEHF